MGVARMTQRILRRLLTGLEAVVYGPPMLVSSWFRGDTSYGGHDPLASDPPGAHGESVL